MESSRKVSAEQRKIDQARSMWESLINNEDNVALIRNADCVDDCLMMKLLAFNMSKGNLIHYYYEKF
jgi:hypothetical protein